MVILRRISRFFAKASIERGLVGRRRTFVLTSMLHRRLAAFVTLVGAVACSSPTGMPPIRTQQAAGSSLVRSSSLTFRIFTSGKILGFPAGAVALDIAPGRGGTMWFTNFSRSEPGIGRIASDGTFREFSSGLPQDARPYSIIAGPDGNMWFSDSRGVAIGKITPQGTITEYIASEYAHRYAKGIAFGPGGEPWILAVDVRRGGDEPPLLAHLNRRGTIEAQMLPAGMDPVPGAALAADAGGNLWFVALIQDRHVGELVERRADSGRFFRVPLDMDHAFVACCPNVAPKSIAIGADRDPWFTTLHLIYKNSPRKYLGTLKAGRVKLFPIHTEGLREIAFPSGLAAAARGFWITGSNPLKDTGGLWYFDGRHGQVAYIPPHAPLAVAVDAAGNPWFTAESDRQPSRIIEVLRR